jgi:NADH-quinone oxidoreductase subunit N
MDSFALFYMGLLFAASFAVVLLAHGYLARQDCRREEFYLLVLLATLGSAVLAAATHFASFFLGLETLSVSLYAMVAYVPGRLRGVEAGIKYLVLAATSAAMLLFGMALHYAATGRMDFDLAGWHQPWRWEGSQALSLAGVALMMVGIGFKLGVVPFHLWTPDVYEGAPAPVTAFVATVSKGAVFALALRLFAPLMPEPPLVVSAGLGAIALASMVAGNLLALFQNNVKRLLAYSSIAHFGYLLITLLASGPRAVAAATFYLVAYFATTLGAFGVITILSGGGREADRLEDYTGLARRRPVVAGIFTAMLLSLAGIPLTAGFVGKFLVLRAGVGTGLWALVLVMVAASVVGLFYYLRVVMEMFKPPPQEAQPAPAEGVPRPAAAGRAPAGTAPVPLPLAGTAPVPLPLAGGLVLAAMVLALVWLGVYPAPLLNLIEALIAGWR